MNVFKATDVYQLFDDITNERALLHVELKKINEDFGYGVNLLFDDGDKYVAVASNMHVIAISL